MDNKNTLKNVLRATAFISASMLMGCGGSSEPPTPTPTPTPNSAPVAVDDTFEAGFNVATDIAVLANDTDADGDTLSIASISYSGDGTATISGSAISYTPTADFLGVEQIGYTITDGNGGEATASLTVDVGLNLILQGKVTDGPIANAAVTVSVGDEQFTAVADGEGNYQVSVRAHSNSYMEISAQGVDEQAFVSFNSLVGQAVALAMLAGDDAILSKNEAARVNITNFSTAESVFVKALNNDAMPASDADLVRLLNQLDSGEVMKAAAAIKLVVDDENYELPAGVSDTLAFISDSEALGAFTEAAGDDLTAAIQAIAADSEITTTTDLTSFITNDGQTGSFILFEEGRREGSYLDRDKYPGSLIQFNSDGTGSLNLGVKAVFVSFAWQVDGNKLKLTDISYIDSIPFYTLVNEARHTLYGQQTIDQIQLSLINSNATFADFSADTDFSVDFAEYPAANATASMVSQWKLQKLPLTGNVTPEQLTNGSTWYMPAYRPDMSEYNGESLMFDGLVFAQDGSGTSGSGNSFNWEFNEQGLLSLSYADESHVVYHSLYLNDGSLGSTTAVLEKNNESTPSQVSLYGIVVEQDTSYSVTDDMLAKRWHQFDVGEGTWDSRTIFGAHFQSFRCAVQYGSVGLPCNPSNYSQLFFSDNTSFSEQWGSLEIGFAFYEGGFAHEIALNEADLGYFEANNESYSNLFSSWQRIDDNKGLLIQQGYDEGYGEDPFCDYTSDACQLYFHYQVYPLYQVGDRMYVYYVLKNEEDFDSNTLTPNFSGVTFYTLADPVITQGKASASPLKLSELKRHIIK